MEVEVADAGGGGGGSRGWFGNRWCFFLGFGVTIGGGQGLGFRLGCPLLD